MSLHNDQPRVPAGEPGGGRWIQKEFSSYEESLDDLLAHLAASIGDDAFDNYGIRVEDVDTPAKAGDALPPSRVWVDGEATTEILSGTSVLGVASADRAGVDAALKMMGLKSGTHAGYFGKVIYLIGGGAKEHGEDPGEVIIRDAKVIAVYTRNKEAFHPIERRL